jgi:hypothetical protein
LLQRLHLHIIQANKEGCHGRASQDGGGSSATS